MKRGEGQSCNTCHFGRRTVPNLREDRPEQILCTRPDFSSPRKPVNERRAPTDWCDQWTDPLVVAERMKREAERRRELLKQGRR